MDLRVVISLGLLAILGFLFYPRDAGRGTPTAGEWISIKRTLDDEPLHGAKLRKDNPVVKTYDLGYIYKIDKAEVIFNENPRSYEVLASTVKSTPKYDRIGSTKSTSREYYYPVIPLAPKESRWVQVVVNDWYRTRPKITSTKIGARYQQHSPVKDIRTKYNQDEVFRLIDGLKSDSAPKWIGGRRIEQEVEKEKETVKEVTYESPDRDGMDILFDFGSEKRIYGVAVTTGGDENNLKQYEISTSVDGRDFQQVYVSEVLENKTITDSHIFGGRTQGSPLQARLLRLTIGSDGWYGKYPEIREVEIYTDGYRLSEYAEQIEAHNAIQVYYDNCGMSENAQAPDVIQGFPFDRGEGIGSKDRYFLKPGEEVDAKNSLSERSFCYHYDRIILSYPNLEPDAMYWVQVRYLQEKKANRIQSLDVDGFLLHDGMEIPANLAEKLTFAIPPDAYADGEMELHFNRLAGPNAVVSEVALLRASRAGMLARVQPGESEVIAKVPEVATSIAIDGVLDEWPLIFPLVPQQYSSDSRVAEYEEREGNRPLDSPCQMYVQWDSDNLFIALRVTRDASRVSSDTLHVFVDAGLTRSPGMYKTGDHHFRFLPLGVPTSSGTRSRVPRAAQIHHHLDAIPRTIEDNKEIEVATSRIPGTSDYVLEARIPKNKALYEFSPQSGSVIGFNYILSNPDLAAEDQLSWTAADTGASPVLWGKLELVGTVSAQLAIMDQNFTNKLTDFSAAETLVLAVWDPDRNTDRNSPQSIKVRVSGDLTEDRKEIVLHETTQIAEMGKTVDNSDLFAGELLTEFGTSPSQDPLTLVVQGKEVVTLSYLDPYYGPNQNDVNVTASVTVRVGTTGIIQIVSESAEEIKDFNAGDRLFFKVEDTDLVEKDAESSPPRPLDPAPLSVTVASSEDTEVVTLVDEENSGVFIGSIETVYNMEGAADGILQVVGYEIIKATYRDSIQATGNTNVPVEAEAIVNIGNTGILSIGKSETGSIDGFVKVEKFNAGDDLFIRLIDGDLNTDRAAIEHVDVKVEGDTILDSVVLTLAEMGPSSFVFSGLLSTVYSPEADESNDMMEVIGNEALTFTYNDALQATGATGVAVNETAVVNIGNNGTISILRSNYFWDLENFNAGDTLYFKVEDADLNVDSGVRDRVDISVTSDKTQDSKTITLEERNANAGVFFGSLETRYSGGVGAPTASVGNILKVQGDEKVAATYLDGLRSTGETNIPVTDSCKVNVGQTGKITVYNKANPYTPIAGFPDEGWKSTFKAGGILIIHLEDTDLNVTDAAAEIFQVDTTEDVIRDFVPVILTEVAGSAGVFTGEVRTEYGVQAIPGDGILQVQGEGRVNISYNDAITDTGQTNALIPVGLTVETGAIGTIQALEAVGEGFIPSRTISSFSAGDGFIIRVRDGDLNVDPEAIDRATVITRGNLLEDELQVLLQETELNSGVFDGRVQSAYASQADLNDTVLQVREKEVFLFTYIDAVGVTGETDVPVSVELVVRSGSAGLLLIVDEDLRELPSFSAGRKLYFKLDDFVLSSTSPDAVARITVRGEGTKDTEEVMLEEKPGEQGIYIGSIATSYGTTPVHDGILQVRGGAEIKAVYRPQTPGTPSKEIVDTTYTNKGAAGRITITGANGLKLANFSAGDTLYFKLEDFDLNLNAFEIDTVDIWVVGDVIAGGKTVTLNETSEDLGVFTGSIDTKYGRGVFESRGILEVVGGEQVTAVYYDALTSAGETDVKVTDSCRSNMLGTATYASESVVLDGSISGWPLENSLQAGDEGSNLYVQWDRDNLYILAYVMDPDVVVPDATKFWDSTDALEIHIDTDPTSETSAYLRGLKKPSNYFFWFCPKGAGPDGNRPYVGQNMPETVYDYTAIETVVRIFPGSRYVLEIRIPFDPVLGSFDPYKTSEADRIGFNYIIRRSNASQIRWALGTESEPNLPPSFFGTLILKQP